MNRLAALACLLFLGAAPRAAQRSQRAVDDDLAFAAQLATRATYVDLAEGLLAEIEKEPLTDPQKEYLALVRCQVRGEGARGEGDRERRLERLEQAADAYGRFLDGTPRPEFRRDAQRSYLRLLTAYVRALESARDGAAGEEALEPRATSRRVLDEGLARTQDLANTYERAELAPAEALDKWRVNLERAQLRIASASVADDPEVRLGRAEEELERLIAEAGRTSGAGLNAALALVKLKRARGEFGPAAVLAELVTTTAVPENGELAQWKELRPEARAERFQLVELALPDLVACHAANGDAAAACRWSLYFLDTWQREHFSLSPSGSLALLSAARTLLDAGGYVGGTAGRGDVRWFATDEERTRAGVAHDGVQSALELALRCACDVSRANRGNTLEARAQELLSAGIRRPGATPPPDVLLEAAQGEYERRDFARGIETLARLRTALESADEATRREYMPRLLVDLGRCQAALARPLEAAMAFREAATTWADDAELQAQAARGFYERIHEVRRASGSASPGDEPDIEELCRQAEQLLVQWGQNDDLAWSLAERHYDAREYALARQGYRSIGAGASEYERARVKAALCLDRQDDLPGARQELRAYVEEFVRDPSHAVQGAGKLAAREEARAQALFSLGRMAYEARAYDEALAWLTGYESEFATQSEYAADALYLVVNSHLARRDLSGARAALARLLEKFPTHVNGARAALHLYQALRAEPEVADEAGAPARSQERRREMAQCLRIANRIAPEPAFANLRLESSLWIELEDWAAAKETLRATLRRFQGQADRAADLERYVLPDLGTVLLAGRRASEAFALLDPLLPRESGDARRPSAALVRAWCRSVTGWPEGDGAQRVALPGAGGAANLARAAEYLGQLRDAEGRSKEPGHGLGTCPWYELEFERLYAWLLASAADPSRRGLVERGLEDLAAELGDPDLAGVGRACGDEGLRRRFLWLRERVR